ncbi:TPA: laccase domain-containing protein, partial [Haemophilus influenzae]
AATHAGWRGLCDGVLEETVKYFQAKPEDIIAWFGPAIGPKAFQVGIDVVEKFVAVDEKAKLAFQPDAIEEGKY